MTADDLSDADARELGRGDARLLDERLAVGGLEPDDAPETPAGDALLGGVAVTELDAFVAEARTLDATLADVPDDAWSRPALGVWTLAELVAHLVGGVERVGEYLDQPVTGPAVVDRVGYYRYDPDEVSPGVARRAAERARGVAPARLPQMFAAGWRAAARRVEGLAPGHLTATLAGPMRLNEYLATRVCELVVHHLDVRRACDLPAAGDPSAARLTVALLEGLLGAPRPRNMGRTRFLLAATGRVAVDDPRFPVLR